MGWHRADEDFRADHYRDERKHEPRPGDRGFSRPSSTEPPARLHPPISEALEVAILIKCPSTSLQQAAELIAAYAGAQAAAAKLDGIDAAINRMSGAQP